LDFRLGALVDQLVEELRFTHRRVSPAKQFRKRSLRLETDENGPESDDSGPFSIARNVAQQELGR
jgi:hypothetical protein